MRAAFEHIEATPELSWKWFRRRLPQFPFTWHYHHEYELTLITAGTGTRFVGDSIEQYAPGDLVLIGPDLPHTYASAPGEVGNEALVIQFRRDFLGPGFLARPEFAEVASLLDGAGRGLRFPGLGPHRSTLRGLDRLPPPQRTLRLLAVLVELAGVPAARPLASEHHRPALHRAAGDRIDAVMRLLHDRYAEPLTLADVAAAAHLTPPAASRFFRRTTGSTVTGYLNALRVNAACRLLAETDRRVADIAADCGYHNLSHFNRRFRALKGLTPRAYRDRFRSSARGDHG